MSKVAIPEGTYKFIVVRCQTIGCACKTAIDSVAVGPRGGLISRKWSCRECGGEYEKSGNEILTIFASRLGVFKKHQDRVANDHPPSIIEKRPAVDEPSQAVQNIKESELDSPRLGICLTLLVLALIYVPVEACNASYCVSYGWKWLWSLERLQVSGLRLFIQVMIATVVAGILWKLDIKSLFHRFQSPPTGSKTYSKPKQATADCPSLLNVWTKFILGVIVASLLYKPALSLGGYAILQSAIVALPLLPWLFAIDKRHKLQKNNV